MTAGRRAMNDKDSRSPVSQFRHPLPIYIGLVPHLHKSKRLNREIARHPTGSVGATLTGAEGRFGVPPGRQGREKSTCGGVATSAGALKYSRGFAPVVAGFAKALEIPVNAILRGMIPQLPKQARLANLDGRTVSLDAHGPLALGELARAIGGERELNQALTAKLRDGGWFTGSLPAIIDEFRSVRNPAIHSGRVDRKTATHWRNRMLGIGGEGIFARLAQPSKR